MEIENSSMIYRGSNELARVYRGDTIVWEPGGHDISRDYFTIEVVSGSSSFGFSEHNQFWGVMQYSLNRGTWSTFGSEGGFKGPSPVFNTGDKIRMRYTSLGGAYFFLYPYQPSSDFKFRISGNILSLYSANGFRTLTACTKDQYFTQAFQGDVYLISAQDLYMPLPSGLTYVMAFKDCTSLVEGPVLPAETLPQSAYWDLFYNCSNLQSVTCLATDITAESSTLDWMYGVPSGGVFTKSPNMSTWSTGDSGIPSGWTVVDAE